MGKGKAGSCFAMFLNNLALSAVSSLHGQSSNAAAELSACLVQKGASGIAGGVTKIGSTLVPGRRKFGEVPRGLTHDGREVKGEFGARMQRTKGDYVKINESIGRMRQETAVRKQELINDYQAFQNNPQLLQERLDQRLQFHDQELLRLREQYDLYGSNSVQGRAIEQRIKSEVYLLNETERLAGYRVESYTASTKINRAKPGDFGYIPEGGEFGRRAQTGGMSNAEKTQMQSYRDRWKIERADAYDSIKSGFQSEMDRDYQTFTQKLEHNVNQRELYRGTDWKRTLDYEILRDLKVLKALNQKDPTRYQYKPYWNEEYLPNHLRNQL
ncbi:hypothetical protein NIES4075_67960 [Tolypothrix sp. NIES-4075]|nr:hypothetical protein NIES4075_67960 [Tolypothrix sp. NIES-4075]